MKMYHGVCQFFSRHLRSTLPAPSTFKPLQTPAVLVVPLFFPGQTHFHPLLCFRRTTSSHLTSQLPSRLPSLLHHCQSTANHNTSSKNPGCPKSTHLIQTSLFDSQGTPLFRSFHTLGALQCSTLQTEWALGFSSFTDSSLPPVLYSFLLKCSFPQLLNIPHPWILSWFLSNKNGVKLSHLWGPRAPQLCLLWNWLHFSLCKPFVSPPPPC